MLLGVAIALPVSADAPIDQYEGFVSGNTTITDHYTRLVWERPGTYPAAMKFTDAKAHCSALGAFRLPSMKELLTIVDETPHDEYEVDHAVPHFIDQSAFRSTPAEAFWTSSMKDSNNAWTVDFGTGGTGDAQISGDQRRVRCVQYKP